MTKNRNLTRENVREIYNRQAKFYDLAVWFYYLVGMRIGKWRRMAVDGMQLRPGDTVVEMGCGNGLNFAPLQQAIGREGRIIGVDFSEAMLDRARALVREKGWQNVELVCSSASEYRFPDSIDGILATGVLTYEPEFDGVIERGAKALSPGRKWAVLDYKMPQGWLRWFAPLFIALGKSFGMSRDFMERQVWISVERHLEQTKMQELYGGFVYIVTGRARSKPS
jgi:demethylmenaquinone methyltransferase/2-methoxy-6-polyprenyl-1,4-benzoquinol methylase